jgi:hypothetical protein
MGFSRNYFVEEKLWTKSIDCWTAPARSTMDRQPLPHTGAHRSLASGHSGAREFRPRGKGGRGKHGAPDSGLTGAQNAAEQRRDDGEGALGAGSLAVRREGKEGQGRSGGWSECRGALL